MRVAVSRAPGGQRVVTPLELFFDLVCVFGIGRLSHRLLEHVDLRTAAATVILAQSVDVTRRAPRDVNEQCHGPTQSS